jgi:hypothetical protein
MYGGGFRLKKTLPPTLRAITHLVRCNKGCHDDVSIKKGLELVGCDVEQHLPAAENKYWLRDQLGENARRMKTCGKLPEKVESWRTTIFRSSVCMGVIRQGTIRN